MTLRFTGFDRDHAIAAARVLWKPRFELIQSLPRFHPQCRGRAGSQLIASRKCSSTRRLVLRTTSGCLAATAIIVRPLPMRLIQSGLRKTADPCAKASLDQGVTVIGTTALCLNGSRSRAKSYNSFCHWGSCRRPYHSWS